MKLIHTTTDQINGGSCRYHICDSVEEFNAKVEEYKERAERNPWEHINTDATITCEPTTMVSDGFATRGGRKIKAKGITCWTLVGLRGCDEDCIINPTTLEINEGVKAENWWA